MTQTIATHTPTPWRTTPQGYIASQTEGFVPLTTPFREDAHRDQFRGPTPEAAANAAYICLAVNSHAALVAVAAISATLLKRLDLEATERAARGDSPVFPGAALRASLRAALAVLPRKEEA